MRSYVRPVSDRKRSQNGMKERLTMSWEVPYLSSPNEDEYPFVL